MKAAISLSNYIRNPNFVGGATGWSFNQPGYWDRTYFASGGVNNSSYARTTKLITGNSDIAGFWQSATVPVSPGDSILLSYYMRPSVAMTGIRIGMESYIAGVNQGASYAPVEAAIDLPANQWTRVSYIFTYGSNITSVRPSFYKRNGDIAVGETIDYCGAMVSVINQTVNYRDGDSSGWSWTGTANNSISTGAYFLDKALHINGRMNYCPYPNFSGTGTVATGWISYANGGSGSRSVSGNKQTVVLNSTTGLGRYGVSMTASNNQFYATENEMLFFAFKVDPTGIDPGTVPEGLAVINFSDGSSVNWGVYTNGDNTMVSRGYVVPAGKIATSAAIYAFMRSTTTPWTGTSTGVFSEYLLMKRLVSEVWTTYNYFDGNSSGAKWLGAANASQSMKPEWLAATAKRWNGTAWVTA